MRKEMQRDIEEESVLQSLWKLLCQVSVCAAGNLRKHSSMSLLRQSPYTWQ